MAATAPADEAYRIVSAAVDPGFYKAVYPELDGAEFDPIRHYLERGWREGCDPAPWFSVRGYLKLHPDVAVLGEEPLGHYLLHGAAEGRAIEPSEHAARYRASGGAPWTFEPRSLVEPPPGAPPEPEPPHFHEAERKLVASEFDADFYLDQNPDLAGAEIDLVEHFMIHGWREARDPVPWFSIREYLANNPDVEKAGVNPFLHYLATGRPEGRAPRSVLGFRYKIIATQRPLAARVAFAEARSRRFKPELTEAFDLLAVESRTGLEDVHITFSHDDYFEGVGGVQVCLQHESARIAERGVDHLHIHPATLWPVLRRDQESLLGVMLNGRALGAYPAETIARGLAKARAARHGRGSFAIHNLLGHKVDEVVAILGAAGLKAGFLWLHDFTSLCAGYQLLRNDVQDCAAPPPDSAACGICVYQPGRLPQIAEHERLFRALDLTVVSPAQTTLDFWRASWPYAPVGAVVHPHLKLRRRGPAPERAPGPLRLAFLGQPSAHKGWPIFAEMAADFSADPRYQFFHLGGRRDRRAAVEFHHVMVSVSQPHAMQDALERLQIDVAVIWSIFRETYCLAAYEALAAGCAVVTSPDSANVAAMIAAGELEGRVLADDKALAAALASGDLQGLARDLRRPSLYDVAFSGMTADLLEKAVAA